MGFKEAWKALFVNQVKQAPMIAYSNVGTQTQPKMTYSDLAKEGYQEKGSYNATFNGASFPSGIYFYQLSSKDFIQTRKMSLIK